MEGQTYGHTNGRTYGHTDGRTYERSDGQTDRPTYRNGRTHQKEVQNLPGGTMKNP